MKDLNNTAHKILDIAEDYTQKSGFNAFSYKDIQNEVGIKTSSIHYYFPSKNDLAMAMTERFIERFNIALKEINTEKVSGLARLETLCNSFFKMITEGKFCLCGMLASDNHSLPESVNNKLLEFFELTETWIMNAIELGIEQREFKNSIQAKHAAAHFLASLEGAMLIAKAHKTPTYLTGVMEQALLHLKN